MRSVMLLASCALALLAGCASPKPVAQTATATGPTRTVLTEDQKANQLIDKSIKSGEAIKTSDGQNLICKQEAVTNTRLKNRRICLTEAQWLARSDNAKDGFSDAKRAGEYLPPKGN